MRTQPVLAEALEGRLMLAFSAKINFQPPGAPVPSGYVVDSGLSFAARNGLSYGWNGSNQQTRDRNSKLSPDQRYDTLILMGSDKTHVWELAVPNGTYQVQLVCGDAGYTDSRYEIAAEGLLIVDGFPSAANRWVEGGGVVTVSDGRLTLTNAAKSKNNKLCFIDVQTLDGDVPQVSVSASDPDASESGPDTGTFTFTRTGDTTSDLTVNFTLTGGAINGIDYDTLPTSVTIPAGQSSTTLDLVPKDDGTFDPAELATLTLANSASYVVAQPSSASVTIQDNDVQSNLFSAHVNFQPEPAPKAPGYSSDYGLKFAGHSGGLQFGWEADNTGGLRDRNSSLSLDQRYDTLASMQYAGKNHFWEIAVPNGTYRVHLVAGDAQFYTGNKYKITVEGALAINTIPTSANRWAENTVTVSVTDGRLTIGNASGAVNNRINFLDVQQVS